MLNSPPYQKHFIFSPQLPPLNTYCFESNFSSFSMASLTFSSAAAAATTSRLLSSAPATTKLSLGFRRPNTCNFLRSRPSVSNLFLSQVNPMPRKWNECACYYICLILWLVVTVFFFSPGSEETREKSDMEWKVSLWHGGITEMLRFGSSAVEECQGGH